MSALMRLRISHGGLIVCVVAFLDGARSASGVEPNGHVRGRVHEELEIKQFAKSTSQQSASKILAMLLRALAPGAAFNSPGSLIARMPGPVSSTIKVGFDDAPRVPLRAHPCRLSAGAEEESLSAELRRFTEARNRFEALFDAPVAVDEELVLPKGALVAVVGAGTLLGRSLVQALSGTGTGWRIRSIIAEGSEVDLTGCECESIPLAVSNASELATSLEGADAVIIISAAAGGKGGIEPSLVPKLMEAVGPGVRRLVMASAHGVERSTYDNSFFFKNVFGQLDSQRGAEMDVIRRANYLRTLDEEVERQKLPSFSILRLGALDDDTTSTNAVEGAPWNRPELASGDALGGTVNFRTAAYVLLQALSRPEVIDAKFSLGWDLKFPDEVKKRKPNVSYNMYWDDQFLKLVGPEIWRRPIDYGRHPIAEVHTWLRTWGRSLEAISKEKLKSPISVQEMDDGVLVRFLSWGWTGDDSEKKDEGYKSDRDEEVESRAKEDEWKYKSRKGGMPEGALLIIAEREPTRRIRVVRTEMGEGSLLHKTSETVLLRELDKDLKVFEKSMRKRKPNQPMSDK